MIVPVDCPAVHALKTQYAAGGDLRLRNTSRCAMMYLISALSVLCRKGRRPFTAVIGVPGRNGGGSGRWDAVWGRN